MLVFRKWYSIGLGIRKSPASAIRIKSQTDFVYMETDAELQAVEGPASYSVSGLKCSHQHSCDCQWQC